MTSIAPTIPTSGPALLSVGEVRDPAAGGVGEVDAADDREPEAGQCEGRGQEDGIRRGRAQPHHHVRRDREGDHGNRVDAERRADASTRIGVHKCARAKGDRTGEYQEHRLGAPPDADRDLEDRRH